MAHPGKLQLIDTGIIYDPPVPVSPPSEPHIDRGALTSGPYFRVDKHTQVVEHLTPSGMPRNLR